MTKDKETQQETGKFTKEKQRYYREIINPITSKIQEALILYKLKTGNNGQSDTAQLDYDEDWEINESKRKDSPKKGAVDILGDTENINIINIAHEAYEKIDSSEKIEKNDKELLKKGIRDFIAKTFIATRSDLEKKKHLPHKKFRRYYTLLSQKLVSEGKLSQEEGKLYNNICLSLANTLYDKNHEYIDNEGRITQGGLRHIGRIFLKTVKNIPNSGSSRAFHKIFHDGDFNFLRKENSEGEPIIGTLDHYVRAIMYLMDKNSFNAYEEHGDEGNDERYASRKSFLNNLYSTIYLKDEKVKGALSDKGIIHKETSEQRVDCKDNLEDSKDWDLTARYKTDASKMLKIGGRTKEIKDESGVRATYYGSEKDSEKIKDSIITLCKNYLDKIYKTKGIYIESIQADRKGDFIDRQSENEILEELKSYLADMDDNIEITKRIVNGNKASKLDSVSQVFRSLCKKNPSQGLKQAYRIASGEIKRGANGKYEDFKLIVQYSINKDEYNEGTTGEDLDKDTTLYQEISFYPHNNDLGIGNHNFLDLEKRIFNRVKNMDHPKLGKSISLNRLRWFTESAIKDISFDIDVYEDKVKRGILPEPENDEYKYLSLDGKKLPLDGLISRTAENTKRFDELIPLVLNYFIKTNKIFYINKENDGFHGLITAEQLHDKNAYKTRRFCTSDALRNAASDANNRGYTISFYTDDKKGYGYPNFYTINLGDLGDFISLEKFTK